MKAHKNNIMRTILLPLIMLSIMCFTAKPATGTADYRGMVNEINTHFQESLASYKQGDYDEAKSKVQTAYFQVFEDMEGPIKKNISPEENHELEEEFAAVRKMIVQKAPVVAIDKRMRHLVADLYEAAAILEGRVQAVADKGAADNETTSHKNWPEVVDNLFVKIDLSVAAYQQGKKTQAIALVQDAYFDIFEASGLETKIGAKDNALKSKLENHFSTLSAQMEKRLAVSNIQKTSAEMKAGFTKAVKMLTKTQESVLSLFLYSLMIILREGVEAILIVAAIATYLVKTDNKDKLKVVYNGAISALVLSIVTAVLLKMVFNVSAANQEIMEGITMLLAAVVLFSVSYWLVSKAEAQKWMAYIRGKVNKSLSSGSMISLWFASFLAVYREGAETILFYQALASDVTSSSGIMAIIIGLEIGCLLLVGIYIGINYGAMKLPIKHFFLITGAFLYYMAFVFVGKGMMELVEGKIFTPSLISGLPTVSFMGLFPYWQTLLPQATLLIAAAAAYWVIARQKRAYGKA